MNGIESVLMVFMSKLTNNEEKGNHIYMILLFFLYKILNQLNLENHITSFFSYLFSHYGFEKNKYCITITSHEINIKAGLNTAKKIVYSKTFKSILNYINYHKSELSNVNGYREIMSQMSIDFFDDNKDEFEFIPIENIPITLDEKNKIYCLIELKKK